MKRRIVAEARSPGASVSVVARRHDVNANLLFKWLRDPRYASGEAAPTFLAVTVGPLAAENGDCMEESSPAGTDRCRIDIALPCGARVRCDATVDEQALARVLRALRRQS